MFANLNFADMAKQVQEGAGKLAEQLDEGLDKLDDRLGAMGEETWRGVSETVSEMARGDDDDSSGSGLAAAGAGGAMLGAAAARGGKSRVAMLVSPSSTYPDGAFARCMRSGRGRRNLFRT